MEKFLFCLLFLISFPSLLAFDCSTLNDGALCAQLNSTGCSWVSNTCTGTFVPNCTVPNCYYIDPIAGSDTADGTSGTPYKTFTPGLQSIGTGTASFIVINYVQDVEAEVLKHTTILGTVTLTRMFTGRKYVLSLQNFDISTMPASTYKAFSIPSGKLEIIGAIINEKSVKTGINLLFELTAKLFLTYVSILDYQGTAVLSQTTSAASSAIFNYTFGEHRNSSYTLNMALGTHYLTNVSFINNKADDTLLYLGFSVYMTNVFVQTGKSVFLRSSTDSLVSITGLTIDTYNSNCLDFTNIYKLTFTSSTLKNIIPSSSVPVVRFNGVSSGGVPNSITSVTFQNISVMHTVMYFDPGLYKLYMTLSSVNMDSIRKVSIPADQKTLTDVQFDQNFAGGVCIMAKNTVSLTLLQGLYTKIESHCIAITNAALAITSTVFDNSGLTNVPAPINDDIIDESDGVTFVIFTGANNDISPLNIVRITSAQFIQNKIKSKYGGALRFMKTIFLTVILKGNQFIGNTAMYGGALYCENSMAVVTIQNDIYTQNTATNGGAVYKMTVKDYASSTYALTLTLNNVTYQQNTATSKGGGVYIDYEGLQMINSTFLKNKAMYGAGLCFIRPNDFSVSTKYVSNTTFQDNVASISGGAMQLLFNYSLLNETLPLVFINNTDAFGKTYSASKPSYYRISLYTLLTDKKITSQENMTNWVQNTRLTKLAVQYKLNDLPANFMISHKSGHNLEKIILIEVFDQNNELAGYINNENVTITMSTTNNNVGAFLSGNQVRASFTKGQMYLKTSITLIGSPQTTAILNIAGDPAYSNILNDAEFLIDQDLVFYFEDCEVGDIYNSLTKECTTCAEGFYSLSDPYDSAVCTPCDNTKSTCLGGSKIAANPGFWRYDTETANFLQCPESEACLGGYDGETYSPNGFCNPPYSGNLCDTCDPGYAKFGSSSTCVNCTTDATYYVKFVGFFLLQIIGVLYSVKCNITKISETKKAHHEDDKTLQEKITDDAFQSNLMKILVNFIQICSILADYKLDWPKIISDIVGVTNKTIPSSKEGFSIDCIIALITDSSEVIYFIKLVITLIQPFAIWLVLIISYIGYLKFKKEIVSGSTKFAKTVVVLFVIIAFVLQPSIIQSTLEIFKCQNFSSSEHPVYFMELNSQTQCWRPYHLIWSLAIALPNVVLWALAMPLTLLRTLIQKAKHLDDPEIYSRFSFVYEGLKTDKYYWEFVILGRKVLIILIFVFFNMISIQFQAFATFFILLIFTGLHYRFWPYVDEALNKAELLALTSLLILAYCGMYFLSNSGNGWLNVVMIVFAAIFNLTFFIYLIVLFVKSYKKMVSRVTKQIVNVAEKLRAKRNNSKSLSNSSTLSPAGLPDLKGYNVVFNKIQLGSSNAKFVPNSLEDFSQMQFPPKSTYLQDDIFIEDKQNTIPSEVDNHLHRSKTVFNEGRSSIDNHSILKSPRLSAIKKNSPDNWESVSTPEILKDVIQLYKVRRSSVTNSNDQKYLARSFSVFEKRGVPIEKEED